MQDHGVTGNSVLCVGARDDSEVDFFTAKGYEAIGIDLFTTDKIIKCDMAGIYKHPVLKDKRFDIVYSSESLEHCLDLDGFVKSLALVCTGFFVCMMPLHDELQWWDCQMPDFVQYAGTEEYDQRLTDTFPGFDIVVNEVHKEGTRAFFILERT